MIDLSKIDRRLPIIPLQSFVLFPGTEASLQLTGEHGEQFITTIEGHGEHAIGLNLKQNFHMESMQKEDFTHVGTLLSVHGIEKKSDAFEIAVKALERVQIHEIYRQDGYYYAEFDLLPDIEDMDDAGLAALLVYLKDISKEIVQNWENSREIVKQIQSFTDVAKFMNYVSPYLMISRSEKQELLEMQSLRERGLKILDHLIAQRESVRLQVELAQKVSDSVSKSNREALLREQLKAIQNELRSGSGKKDTSQTLREKLQALPLPQEIAEKALEEADRLEAQGPNNPESSILRNYLEFLAALPWEEPGYTAVDLKFAREVLDKRHFGLEKVKERIIQHLAVMSLRKERKGSILLLVGPPGTGKTSLGKSIAEAMGREFVRKSLGGIKDEAEIRGHRRTYIGALPGRILQSMKKAGSKNPVFILDEVDKIMQGYNGDPASALLEVLDPEQNDTFTDHYLELPYDLSSVFFIATANSLESIPGPLRDRMETIMISGYTDNEKFHIAKDHLVPKVLEEHGLEKKDFHITDETLKSIIDEYTREAGVRNLQRHIETLVRVASEKIVSGTVSLPITLYKADLEAYLGKEKVRHDMTGKINPPGVVTGMAWTPVGGEILFIESTHMPGKGQLLLTGKLGEVMKESAQISLSLIRSRLSLFAAGFPFSEKDIHIHVPSGAVPKDGPSAGVGLFSSLASLILGKRVDPKLSMTGEITLRGSVLPVGGIKEKVLAAHRAGVERVILPLENAKDIDEIPAEIREHLQFLFVKDVDEVLKAVLNLDIPPLFSFDHEDKLQNTQGLLGS